jgi:tRNA-(ms[2]io[6]A)-hydroxylase
MLKLKMATDPRWANVAENNLDEILTDHAFCEQKAASNAISMIVNFPELSDLVEALSAVVIEEMDHFRQVHKRILDRGGKLGKERKDSYVNELYQFVQRGKGREQLLVDRLLFSAMIEARSCERFKLLSEKIKDQELSAWYYELMISEANHYTLFIKLAKKYACDINVDERWEQFLEYEGMIIQKYGVGETMHG